MKSISYFFIAIICVGLYSCVGEFKEVQISSINDFKVTKLTMQGIEGEIKVSINNPNNMSFKVFRSKADIKYGDLRLGKAKTVKKVTIPANSNAEQTFILKGDLKDVSIAELPSLLTGKGRQMEIKGYIKAGKWYFKKKFPIDERQRLKGLDLKGGMGMPGF